MPLSEAQGKSLRQIATELADPDSLLRLEAEVRLPQYVVAAGAAVLVNNALPTMVKAVAACTFMWTALHRTNILNSNFGEALLGAAALYGISEDLAKNNKPPTYLP